MRQNPTTRIVVVGNEKGGSGKSTTAMHLIVSLLRLGFTVGSMDVDSRQKTLTRYIENRTTFCRDKGISLPLPQHRLVAHSENEDPTMGYEDERTRFIFALKDLLAETDIVVIDSPGSDHRLSRLAHSYADTLITPLNDSFIDLDMLATVDPDTLAVRRPSLYAEMVWEQKKERAMRDGSSIDWIVMRNRLSSLDARNKRDVMQVLEKLSRRIGFRLATGFGERVIFRELFLKGLTLLDLREPGAGVELTMSHLAARDEVRALVEILNLPAAPTHYAETA
ncbi:MAG: ATPase [Rhodospirillaceae bacterium]|nr:ATPase [Rhodospirillaceae bacterium]